ncbi:hypothetical protein F3Y22_tig00116959pilonHSYRG00312 [Hibiscus syriacus]|uniref:RNase H type-1 domain-containing protein n=1 Tax=Hibiscus syriacus TaxID=106335 RepID=A0A6A2XZ00_HIBSY|nr:hypothetical protein F3Y22_tig00116959pilonHSYRG00312 [Hibiscus syriacus]
MVFRGKKLDVLQVLFLIKFWDACWLKAKFPDSFISLEALATDISIVDDSVWKKKAGKSPTSWLSPPRGSMKFSFNGAMQEDGCKGGIGGILRDHDGNILLSFSASIGSGSPVQAKILAIDFAIKLFLESRWFNGLIAESDCAAVVNWLFNPCSIPSEWATLLHPIGAMLSQENFEVNFNARKCNFAANQRAKSAYSLSSTEVESQM